MAPPVIIGDTGKWTSDGQNRKEKSNIKEERKRH